MNPSKTLADLLDELDEIQADPMDEDVLKTTVDFANRRRENSRAISRMIYRFTRDYLKNRIVHRGRLLEFDIQRAFFRLVPVTEASTFTATD